MNYEGFMTELKQACRERNACKEGYEQLLRSRSVPEILRTVKDNWTDVWESKYADIVERELPRWFAGQEEDFHKAGVYVNEPSKRGLCMVSQAEDVLEFGGNARVYVFGKARVIARDNVELHCRCPEAEIELRDHAWGKVKAGRVMARDFTTVQSWQEVECHDAAHVTVWGGKVTDCGHRVLKIENS